MFGGRSNTEDLTVGCVVQQCANDEPHTAGRGVTMMLIAIVLMYVLLVAPGEILTFISQHLLAR